MVGRYVRCVRTVRSMSSGTGGFDVDWWTLAVGLGLVVIAAFLFTAADHWDRRF